MTEVKKDATDQTFYVKLIDPTSGDEETGLTITDLDMSYVRNRAAAVKADATALAAADSAHGDNKMIEVDGTNAKGLYRADFPDAAFATGVDKVILVIAGAAIDTAYIHVDLIDNTNGDLKTLIDAVNTDLANETDGLGALKALIDTLTTNVGTVDTVVDGIQTDLSNGTDGLGALKALIDAVNTDLSNATDGLGALKTLLDALTTAVAAVGGQAGSGGTSTTLTITEGGVACDNVRVWVTTDLAGTNVVAGTLTTNSSGEVTFMLDAGDYYAWKEKGGVNFTNPETFTVS